MKSVSGMEIPSIWEQFVTEALNQGLEVVHAIKWDQQTYVDNTTTLLNWFTVFNTDPAQQNGIFPFQNNFLLCAIGVHFPLNVSVEDVTGTVQNAAAPSTLNDLGLLCNNGVMKLTLGTKTYGPFPLIKLQSGLGFGGPIQTGAAKMVGMPQLGEPNKNSFFQLEIPLLLPGNTSAGMQMVWNTVQDLVANRTIRVYLEGLESRAIQ